ncbi:tryptophan-rich sensory protein [Echinicola strongylocentroti]|uniref:Tryptophan-rich sensory protein n=1 Tax=Echinicola strongylocentroti TaxID=1795355 RepID=A0A2Z4IJB6_9BACT|nr:TspO/MBR family protein [Echinicola strongylocentroti]AWW31054.1 tryptophan-rich sensory protein [Echinicola strongylocentroti]
MDTTGNVSGKKINWLHLLLFVAAVVLMGSIAGVANAGNITTWYAELEKPSFNPPNSLFGPVWTVLYALMGLGLYLIWNAPKSEKRKRALQVFVVQFVLNFCWSFIFFYFHLIGWAAVEIVLLLGMIIWMIVSFKAVSKWAAYLQFPYLLWVSFATLLNISIWWLNS